MTGGAVDSASGRAPAAAAHRHLGDPADCWRLLLFGAILRTVDRPAIVRDESPVRLARTGRWETGLARLRPALDDVLGDTAFALACRWASAGEGRRMWPGATLVARKATDQDITTDSPGGHDRSDILARWSSGVASFGGGHFTGEYVAMGDVPEGGRGWMLACRKPVTIHVSDSRIASWSQVDRIADIASAWFDVDWRVIDRTLADAARG